MTRDEAKQTLRVERELMKLRYNGSIVGFNHEAFDQALSDIEMVELLGKVLCELDQPQDDRGFELGKAWAYTQVSEWLENHELLRAEAKRLGVEEES